MTDKDIRHLGKTELLSILREQEAELQTLRAELEALRARERARKIELDECGSIAEASLRVNGVFQAAQAAADQYLASIHEKEARAESAARQIEGSAKQRAEEKLRSADVKCRQMEEESEKNAAAYWDALQTRLEEFYKSHEGLKDMLTASGFDVKLLNRSGPD